MAELLFWLVINSEIGLNLDFDILSLSSAAGQAGREKLGEEMNFEEIEIYIRKGFSIIPVGQDKRPLIPWAEFQRRKPLNAELLEWFSRDGINVAIVCGKISNLTVVDCDTPEAIEKFEAMLPENFECPIVETPRGGRHYYFQYTPELYSRNKAIDGIDIKSEGGYVLAPPSQINGKPYKPHSVLNLKEVEPPPMPEITINSLKQGLTAGYTPPEGKYVLDEGNRDNFIFHLALNLFKDGLSYEGVKFQALQAARAARPPFPEKEALRKVESAWKRFLARKNSSKLVNLSQTSTKQNGGEEEVVLREREMTSVEIKPVEWLWYPVAAFGMVGTILGNPGIGKSYLLADIAARISAGRPLPVYKRATDETFCGWVIYITSEGVPEKILKPRLYAAGANFQNLTLIEGLQTCDGQFQVFDVRHHLPLLLKRIQNDSRQCLLVIIDPIASFISEKVNLNDSVQVRYAFDAIARFAEEARVAVLVAIHPNKDETKKVMARAAGSLQLAAAVKTCWLVTGPRASDPLNVRYFSPYKIRTVLFDQNEALPFYLEDASFEYNGKKIEVARIDWQKELVKFDIEEHLSPRVYEGKGRPAAHVRAWLVEQLKNGPRLARDIYEAGEEEGFSKYQIWRAKNYLGVEDSRSGEFGGPSKWQLPQNWSE
jgi:hypothetical protein